jgi:hypothetical protein
VIVSIHRASRTIRDFRESVSSTSVILSNASGRLAFSGRGRRAKAKDFVFFPAPDRGETEARQTKPARRPLGDENSPPREDPVSRLAGSFGSGSAELSG